jgi:molybdate transport system substrate-binding protein
MQTQIRNLTWWVLFLACALRIHANEINVFAAASLTDSLKQVAADYEQKSGDKIVFNFAASSLLARQIMEGAPADVFFSADEAKMDALAKKDLVVTETRKSRLSNTLVIVVAADSTLKISSVSELTNVNIKHIALADPKAVPAGIYAREYLEKKKLWPAVEAKVIPTENVRAALAAVESGNVEVGMVYKTDAAISKKVRVACEISTDEGPVISYPVAVMKESRSIPSARKFVEYIDSPDAARIFQSYGFIILK